VVPEPHREPDRRGTRGQAQRNVHGERDQDAAERDRAWGLALDQYAGYGDYKAGDRTIPLIRLERITS
jgi:hypothetical protein